MNKKRGIFWGQISFFISLDRDLNWISKTFRQFWSKRYVHEHLCIFLIRRANLDPSVCRHMAPPVNNELNE